MLTPTVASLFLFAVSLLPLAIASPCIAMDADFNLLVFGLGGKDFNAGTQDTWTGSTSATDITVSGRPPFDTANTTCYLAQFFNAVYVLNGDSSNPTAVYIYDAAGKSWTKQSVSSPSGSPAFDPTNYKAILDHDTNVFYALSNGETFNLDFSSITTSAQSSSLSWSDVGTPSFTVSNYNPVMALAQNHIHFLDVPGASAGQAFIFVIHFSFFQPDPQSYPVNGGGNFPEEHGQAVSIFQPAGQGVQQEFAFIPDDGSATYVINVETNTTQSLAGPSTKDTSAQYFAGVTSIVQLSSSGALSFLPYNQNDTSANAAAQWTSITTVSIPPETSSSGSSPSGTSAKSFGAQPTGNAQGSSTASTTGTNSGAERAFTSFLTPLFTGAFIIAVLL